MVSMTEITLETSNFAGVAALKKADAGSAENSTSLPTFGHLLEKSQDNHDYAGGLDPLLTFANSETKFPLQQSGVGASSISFPSKDYKAAPKDEKPTVASAEPWITTDERLHRSSIPMRLQETSGLAAKKTQALSAAEKNTESGSTFEPERSGFELKQSENRQAELDSSVLRDYPPNQFEKIRRVEEIRLPAPSKLRHEFLQVGGIEASSPVIQDVASVAVKNSVTNPSFLHSSQGLDPSAHIAIRDQVVALISARAGETRIEVRLDPPELGRIGIQFSGGEDGLVRAVVSAESPETIDLLRRHMDSLLRELDRNGISGVSVEIDDNTSGERDRWAGRKPEPLTLFHDKLENSDAPSGEVVLSLSSAEQGRINLIV